MNFPKQCQTKFRRANGGLQWLVSNTRPDLAAKVSLNQISDNKVYRSTLADSAKIIRQAHAHSKTSIAFSPIPLKEVRFSAFHDAGWGVRKDNSSQGGLLILAGSSGLERGELPPVSLIEWRSWKLERVCRSSLSSEAQAQSEALDQLNYVRLCWSELLPTRCGLSQTR